MSKPVVTKLDPLIRGDTPLLSFPATVNGVPYDLTGWDAKITITANQNPTSLTGALVSKAAATVDGSTITYQLTTAVTNLFVPDTTYYGDVELSKDPVATNTFTPIRFKFTVVTDYGV